MKKNITLRTLLQDLPVVRVVGSLDISVSMLAMDSRKVEAGACFFALSGTQVDGHNFIPAVIEKGAVAIVCSCLPQSLQAAVTYVCVVDPSKTMGFCASAFYGHPSRQLSLVGVTGTNGKTTTVTLLHRLFRSLGCSAGLLSTIRNQIDDEVLPATHTTPDALELQALLAQMVEAGCSHAFMEVSSHAICQGRIAGVHFAGGVFSNITRDHLDYHKTFEAYLKAKKAFFDGLPKTAFALTNADDKNGDVMLQNSKAKAFTYGLKNVANFRCKVIENAFTGLHLLIDGRSVYCRLVGQFNAYNFLAVYATALLLGVDKDEALLQLSRLEGADGRFEAFRSPEGIVAIVDYAHTPDALENVLQTIRKIREEGQCLITVVGCGGDRDTGKRPLMAQIAARLSDKVILTSDNPRSEDPRAILDEMEKGLDVVDKRRAMVIVAREEAIQNACMQAKAGDIVLVAGKGHENYQEIKGIKYPFDDKEKLHTYLD